jgi:hypothetical protein
MRLFQTGANTVNPIYSRKPARKASNQIFRSAFRQEQLDGHETSTGEIGDQEEVSLVPGKQASAQIQSRNWGEACYV